MPKNVRKPTTHGPNIMTCAPRESEINKAINMTDAPIPQAVRYVRRGTNSTIVIGILGGTFCKVTIQLDDIRILQCSVCIIFLKKYQKSPSGQTCWTSRQCIRPDSCFPYFSSSMDIHKGILRAISALWFTMFKK